MYVKQFQHSNCISSTWIKTNTNSSTYLVYNTVVRLCQFFVWRESYFSTFNTLLLYSLSPYRQTDRQRVTVVCLVGVRSILWPEKKVLVVCLADAQLLLRPEKKDTVVCLAGARSLLRPEKKDTVVPSLASWGLQVLVVVPQVMVENLNVTNFY
jgi:hypothetical protein